MFNGKHPRGSFLRRVFLEGNDFVLECDALVVIAHKGRNAAMSDCFNDLIRPGRKINKISQTEDSVWLPFI